MGFSRGFGSQNTPTTFAACQHLWDSRHSKKKDYVTLGANTLLHFSEHRQEFYVTFHGNTIVRYYPGYKTIDACGHSSSPTTQARISRLTGATMHSNSSLGFHETVRVNGWPYFDGMRVDDFGQVPEEDRRSDFKTRPAREWALRYATLWRRIHKVLLARWELGEFQRSNYQHVWGLKRTQNALLEVEDAFAAGVTHIEHDVAMDLLYGDAAPAFKTFKDLLDARKKYLREWWLNRNNGYETIEVK